MYKWFLHGLIVSFISLFIAWITGLVEILVFFNEIIGILSLAVAFYIHIGLSWFYHLNELRNNHDQADYEGRNLLKYKFIAFGLPNVLIGESINRVFNIWT